MKYEPLFPSIVGIQHLPEDNNAILEYCLAKQKESKGRVKTNFGGGWQSYDLIYEDWKDNHAMSSLFQNLQEHTNQYHIDNGLREDARCFISNWWINISSKNSRNILHAHPHSAVSGVYYVKCDPEVHPGICFSTPLKVKEAMWSDDIEPNENQKFNYFTSGFWTFELGSGNLVLFPSWLEHSVGETKTDDIRVSIAFNTQVKPTNAAN